MAQDMAGLDLYAAALPTEAASEGVLPPPVSEEDALSDLRQAISEAIDYVDSDLAPNWNRAQDFYGGETDIAKVTGQSAAVATVVRDALRAAKPSLLRLFMQSGAVVEYIPSGRISGDLARQQTQYVNDLFFRSGGYRIISDVIQNAGLKRLSPIKWWYETSNKPRFLQLTGLLPQDAESVAADPRVRVVAEEARTYVIDGVGDAPSEVISLVDMEVAYTETHGEIRVASLPLAGFFISRNATCVEDARVVGHYEDRRVGDMVALGIPYDLLKDLDANDPEQNSAASAEANARRKSTKQAEAQSLDPMMKLVSITDCYAEFDLLGLGAPQVYHFILGGTSRELLHMERVPRKQICVAALDLEPHTVVGTSFYDILAEDQNTQTSILRGTINNLHMANNRRLVFNDLLTNVNDVLDRNIGHPIRSRDPNGVHEVGVQPILQSGLPFMQWLAQRSNIKIGVTDAAAGLDPDALQSTDADAVKNTIMLSQGQIEMMARNIAETLKPLFVGLLELSIRHFDQNTTMTVHGKVVPVNQALFEPSLFMQPKVGIGTRSNDQRFSMLSSILAQQWSILEKMGPANPYCQAHHVSNTLEDMAEAMNIHNIDRYFSHITPEMGAEIAKQASAAAAEQKAKDDATPPPTVALLESERIKARAQEQAARIKALADQLSATVRAEFDALAAAAKDDFERDKLYQQMQVKLREIAKTAEHDKTVADVTAEQKKPRDPEGNTR